MGDLGLNRDVTRMGAAAALVLGACFGGGGDGGGGGFDTGLSDDRPVSSLTDTELRDACESFASSLSSTFTGSGAVRAQCTVASVESLAIEGAEPTRAACEERVSQCVDEGLGQDASLSFDLSDIDCQDPQASQDLQDCDATIGELESCINAVIAKANELLSVLSCSVLTDPEMAQSVLDNGPDGASPFDNPTCQALDEQCPGMFGGTTTEVTVAPVPSGTPSASGCEDTCEAPDDGWCDDGGPDSDSSICALGTDCTDCGPR